MISISVLHTVICYFQCNNIKFLVLVLLLSLQALASERELVLALFDPDAVVDIGPTANRFSKNMENDSWKIEADLTFVLDRIFEGVCRPFKVRVEQVLQSQPSLIVSYKLSNTLEFYSYTVSKLCLSSDILVVWFACHLLIASSVCLLTDIRLTRERNSSLQYTLGTQRCCSENIL